MIVTAEFAVLLLGIASLVVAYVMLHGAENRLRAARENLEESLRLLDVAAHLNRGRRRR